jgi:omega-3 fatty acid desaturase (delta-15 desaturase)
MTTVQRVNNKIDDHNNDNHSDVEERSTSQAALANSPKIQSDNNNYSFKSGIPSDLPKLSTIRQAIPTECFQSNVLKSMYYVVKDTFLIVFLYIGLCYLERLNMNRIAYGFIYPIYWYLQGTMMIAYFVLGHDCGHGSFSQYQLLNDIVGNILHTVVLAPYYPW